MLVRFPTALAFVLALGLLTTGCPEDPGTADAGVPDAGPEDAGPPPPPARELTSTRLFGDMPLDNRVLDPNLVLSGFSWFGMKPTTGRSEQVLRQAFARTPTGQPVLTLPKGDAAPGGVALAGMVRGGEGPLVASIWVGRRTQDVHGPFAVSLTGYIPSTRNDQAIELAGYEGEEELELDGIFWRRYSARLEEGLLGWAMLVVRDNGDGDLLITGPAVVQVDEPTGLLPSRHRPPVMRALQPLELEAARRVRDQLRDSLAAPAPRDLAREAEEGARRLEALRQARARQASKKE